MKFSNLLVLIIMVILLVGCTAQQKSNGKENKDLVDFKSEKYGISFSFPDNWNEVTKDLPDRWAILNNEDTILFTVNAAQIKNLLALGQVQAIRDLYPFNNTGRIKQEKVDEINSVVKLESFNNRDWYTYAIKFSDKNIHTIVSGTLCGENEINLVLVSSFNSYEKNKVIYNEILNSFEC